MRIDEPRPARAAVRRSRWRVPTAAGLSRASELLIDQLRAIDNRRLVKGSLARLGADFMARVGVALCEVLDIS